MAFAAGLVVAAASALRAGRAFTGRFDPDEFQHLHGGWCLAHGLWPYRDYFEHHTPWLWLALAPFFAPGPRPSKLLNSFLLTIYRNHRYGPLVI